MRSLNLSAKIRIGAKLSFALGTSVVLVLGMIASEHLSSKFVEGLVAAADRQQSIANESIKTEVLMQRAQIAGRDLRMAQSSAQVEAVVVQLQQIKVEAEANFATLASLTKTRDQRTRFDNIKTLSAEYTDSIGDIGARQIEILSSFERLDRTELTWTRSINRLINSAPFGNLTNITVIEALVNEAELAFKDARTSAWRYFVLSEVSQVLRITGATDQAIQKLAFARRDTRDNAVVEGIDGLSAIVAEYVAILKSTTDAIDLQNRIQNGRAKPAEDEARQLLDETIALATRLSDRATQEASAGVDQAERTRIAVGLAVTLLLLGTAVFASLAIGNPIRRVGEVLMQLAKGNTSVEIPYTGRSDEIGDTARVAGMFKENLLRMDRIEAAQKEAEERLVAERKAEMHRLADTFEATIGEIVNAVSTTSTELGVAASTLTHTAETTEKLTAVVASAAEQASNNVQSVSQATDDISSSTGEISRQVQESSGIARQAVEQAQITDGRIAELSSAANRIGDVVKLISAIASQTNLLALNATIEAARAGDAGRGFAVVASEVKVLAQRTAEATQEISTHISGIQTATQDSISALQEIGGTISRLAEIASTIAAAVDEQDATTQEISRNVRQAAHGTSQVASSIHDVNDGASRTGSASGRVLSSAQTLAAESNKLRLEADKFLATVRAA